MLLYELGMGAMLRVWIWFFVFIYICSLASYLGLGAFHLLEEGVIQN